ncbi:hypothetical protein [Paraliobacillus sp. JSM ZJ581]|uniref:hypothetical protein n=1 Tax=Paraliobacillus sp. JSM ZJ581 TaxID=3342118 RepID=UPI0035A9A2FE
MRFNIKFFYVIHEKFEKDIKNLIVAISGCLFPIVISSIIFSFINNQITNMFILVAFGNLVMLHPRLPDGENIIKILKEMRDSNGKSV